MRGVRLRMAMADPLLVFTGVEHRHRLPAPKPWKPWATRPGAGVHGVNISLYAGCVLGLIGPNGAGKTTLLRMMAGVLPLQGGTVTGHVKPNTPGGVVDLRTWAGHMPEQVRWQGRTTVSQTLHQLNEMRGQNSQRLDQLLALVGLHDRADEPLDNLSQGMRQRLSIAAALLGSPRVLLLDEPFNGLDPVAAEAFAGLVRRLAGKGVSVVISSHMVTQLEGLIDRIALMHRGQLLDEGPLGEVEKRLELEGRYQLQGKGDLSSAKVLEELGNDVLSWEQDDETWSVVLRGDHHTALKNSLDSGLDVTSWAPVRPNLVEWLCAATGMSFDDISLEVSSSAMLPLQALEVSEDE